MQSEKFCLITPATCGNRVQDYPPLLLYIFTRIDRFDNAEFKSKTFHRIAPTVLLHSSWIKIINNYGNCVMTPLTRVVTKKTKLIRRNFAPDFRARSYLCTFKLWDLANFRTLKKNNMMVCSLSYSLSCAILYCLQSSSKSCFH